MQVETGSQQAKAGVAKTLQYWKANRDFAGIRDEAALAKLPQGGQKACRSLWTEIDTLIKKAQSARP